jgi:hypothetical protein
LQWNMVTRPKLNLYRGLSFGLGTLYDFKYK